MLQNPFDFIKLQITGQVRALLFGPFAVALFQSCLLPAYVSSRQRIPLSSVDIYLADKQWHACNRCSCCCVDSRCRVQHPKLAILDVLLRGGDSPTMRLCLQERRWVLGTGRSHTNPRCKQPGQCQGLLRRRQPAQDREGPGAGHDAVPLPDSRLPDAHRHHSVLRTVW